MPEEKQEAMTIAPEQTLSLVPKNLTEAMNYAKMICSSSLCPAAFRGKPNDALVAIQYGLELVGCSPLQALQNIAVINGRPTMWGDLVMAVVQRSGQMEYIKERDPSEAWTEREGRCEVKRVGKDPVVRTFTYEAAEEAGLIARASGSRGDGPWKTYPGRMLQMRARSWALRDVFADVLMGMQMRDEVEDMVAVNETTSVIMPKRSSEATTADIETFVQTGRPPAAEETGSDAPEPLTWTGALLKIEEKHGNHEGRDWTLYEIHGDGEEVFGTFSKTLMSQADGYIESGEEVVIDYTITPKGGKNIKYMRASLSPDE